MNHHRVRPPSHHLSATYRFATFGDAKEWADQVKEEISGDAVDRAGLMRTGLQTADLPFLARRRRFTAYARAAICARNFDVARCHLSHAEALLCALR